MWTASGNETKPALTARQVKGRLKWAAFLIIVAVALVAWVVKAAPDVADMALRVLLAGVVVVLAMVGYRVGAALVRGRHYRQVLRPVHAALTLPDLMPALADQRPESYLKITRDRPEGGRVVWIKFPESFTGDGQLKERIETRIETKIGMHDLSWSWKLAGAEPTATARRPVKPPKLVRYADAAVQTALAARKESELLLGLSVGGKPVSIDLDGESPHVLIAAGSNGGKSATVRALVVPILNAGGVGIFADVKMTSHWWADDISRLPGPTNIEYGVTIPRIHELLVAVGKEADRRRQVVYDWRGDRTDPKLQELVGPRLVFVLEEVNSTIKTLEAHWKEVRTSDDPKRSPALKALGEFMFMGRTARMHMIMTAQSASANAVGGPEIRENFAARILSNYTKRQWLMLLDGLGYRKPSPVPGRVQVAYRGDADETQVVFYTEEEAYELAREGLERFLASPMSQVPVVPDVADSRSESSETGPIETDSAPAGELTEGDGPDPFVAELLSDEPPTAVTLKEATELLEGISYSSLRKFATSDRDPEFPDPVGKSGKAHMYRSADLLEWWTGRGGKVAG